MMTETNLTAKQLHTYCTQQHLVVNISQAKAGSYRLVNFWKVPVYEGTFDSRGEANLDYKGLSAGLYWLEVFLNREMRVLKVIKASACGNITVSEQETP